MTVAVEVWLDLMGREYMADFVAAGGGAVRFAVAADVSVLAASAAGLRARAEAAGLRAVAVDLAETRLHMLQNLVFAIAGALPWDRLLQSRLETLVAEAGYRWPRPGHAVPLPALAEANGVAAHLLRRDLSQALTQQVWRDAHLAQDFRHAMMALLDARLGGEDAALAEAVMGWLCGTLRSVAHVKAARIGRRIGRDGAGAILVSLCRWVRSCGSAGILLLLDIRRLHRERRQVSEGLVYTPAAVMDCYEVLRELIDDAEHLSGLFVTVLADEALVSDDPRRSLGQYTALQMRVWDDVRPAGGDNPLAPLVRLSA